MPTADGAGNSKQWFAAIFVHAVESDFAQNISPDGMSANRRLKKGFEFLAFNACVSVTVSARGQRDGL